MVIQENANDSQSSSGLVDLANLYSFLSGCSEDEFNVSSRIILIGDYASQTNACKLEYVGDLLIVPQRDEQSYSVHGLSSDRFGLTLEEVGDWELITNELTPAGLPDSPFVRGKFMFPQNYSEVRFYSKMDS